MQVYLVPGFFGFTQLGSFNYFQRVADVLGTALRRRGIRAEIIEVDTQPTSSIRRRALELKSAVSDHGGLEADELHFVGHSTGGLDIRLLLTPGVQLVPSDTEARIATRTASAITLATPHFGTPLANFFTSLGGRNILYLLTLLATSRPGRLGTYVVAQALTKLARLDDLVGQRGTLLDSVSERLLAGLTPDRGHAVFDFMREVASDQGAMVQLTPESIDLFNASVVDQPGVEYVSFVTAAPPPQVRLPGRDIYKYMTHALFRLSYGIASHEHRHYPYPSRADEELAHVQAQVGFQIDPGTNDGIVPTLSQVWARLGGVVVGDHLDVVGQFPHRVDGKRYPGWLFSGSGFDEDRFERLWDDVAGEIAAASDKRGAR